MPAGSFTSTTKAHSPVEPFEAMVPEMTPAESSASPGGSTPLVTRYVTLPLGDTESGSDTTSSGRSTSGKAPCTRYRGGCTVMVNSRLSVRPLLSSTRMLKVKVPACVARPATVMSSA